VVWFARAEGDAADEEMHPRVLIDGRLEVEPRSAGSFGSRWTTLDMTAFATWQPEPTPVILSIDLDSFAGMPMEKQRQMFGEIWERAMDWSGLVGVSIAVSRPWLEDEQEADNLVSAATSLVARTRNAVMEMDASLDDRPDASALAAKEGAPLARWDAASVSPGVRAQWLALDGSLRITDRHRDWAKIFEDWRRQSFETEITADGIEMDCDGVWRADAASPPVLRVNLPNTATGRVRWFALEPSRVACDLLPQTGLGKSFAKEPGRWIHETRRHLVTTSDPALDAVAWSDGSNGRRRIEAEIETSDGWMPVPAIEIRLGSGERFRRGLSECLGMPYVFGIAGVQSGDLTGVETGWGADCSNLLIHAWRRMGLPLVWGDPGSLRAQLAPLSADAVITAQVMDRGVAIDFGFHVAALWEDRPPLGKVDAKDLVLHHLGGLPEIVPLGELARGRPAYRLFVPRMETDGLQIRVAGDVVLAGDPRTVVPRFEKADADLFLANLEGIPSLQEPSSPPRVDFRFPADRLSWLRECGIDMVSLANNHAGDAGADGLLEGLAAVRKFGFGVAGAGRNAAEACRPWRATRKGSAVSVFGVCLVDCLVAGEDTPGVVHLPTHAGILESELARAAGAGEMIVVLVHGGDEYRGEVNADQKHWARWLVRRGARLVVGAHPHVLQRTETHAGAVIAHSLGNAVYPTELVGADDGEVRDFHPVPSR
jgi:hypothetical protein